MTRRHLTAALALLSALALTACIPLPPAGFDTAPESSAPELASEPAAPSTDPLDLDRVTADAHALILDYWSASDDVHRSKGERVMALVPFTTERALVDVVDAAQLLAQDGLTMVGDYTAESTRFSRSFTEDDKLIVVVTTCVDFRDTHVVDDSRARHRVVPEMPRSIAEVFIEVADPQAVEGFRVAHWMNEMREPC